MSARPNQPLALASVFLSGLLFGLGLTVSAMVNPAKVIDFLDLLATGIPALPWLWPAAWL